MKLLTLSAVILLMLSQEVYGQFGFSCTSQASFTALFDGSTGSATCSNGFNLSGRCEGCCEAWAMSMGQAKDSITGFVSSDGNRCTCCGTGVGGGNNGNPQFITNNGK